MNFISQCKAKIEKARRANASKVWVHTEGLTSNFEEALRRLERAIDLVKAMSDTEDGLKEEIQYLESPLAEGEEK